MRIPFAGWVTENNKLYFECRIVDDNGDKHIVRSEAKTPPSVKLSQDERYRIMKDIDKQLAEWQRK